MNISPESIYHVENEHEARRVARIIKRSTVPYPDVPTSRGLWLTAVVGFPRLFGEHFSTREGDKNVNCHGWALGLPAWVDPQGERHGCVWPYGAPPTYLLPAFVRAFELFGFSETPSPEVERGWERVVLYRQGDYCTHSARQLSYGRWTSKLGPSMVVLGHSLLGVSGRKFGEPAIFMRRRA